ncbi:hypothetical protein NA57DRAFT_75865 [Rhizodiscina lignyota]|uniref:YTH domain-containing protein n=1 Tax=Rhizodiscina lignyota TaxID=1504668 RepID=A0A9P4IHM4_9PEZI|nr:hypothetical protein NA57DRAFT_75865 [Rhizodiscina lignyota]
MNFVWVQQWVALPVIVEEPMGDAPSDHGGARPSEYTHGTYPNEESQHNTKSNVTQQAGPSTVDNTPFYSQFTALPPQPRVDLSRIQTGLGSYNMSANPGQGGASFNMGSMASALPDFQNPQQTQRGQPASASAQQAQFRGQQMPQFPSNPPYGASYGVGQFQGAMAHDDGSHGPMGQQTQRSAGVPAMQQQFSPYGQQVPQYFYPTSPFTPQGAQQTFFPGAGQAMQGFDRRTSLGSLQSPQGAFIGSTLQAQGGPRQMQGMAAYGDLYGASATINTAEAAAIPRPASGSSMGSVPRGPPRKPKQSGHALWVGNLPPGTTVLDLKDHFSRDATKDIESLFLISKSNCAFVNYRTEASCTAAMQRFHDSRFHGVRLVCRLRRGSAAPPGVPSGPASMAGPSSAVPQTPTTQAPEEPVKETVVDHEEVQQPMEQPTTTERVADKYFIVKSLTLQDLELSVRNGIWATQAHNEETLNKAYQSADNVYLIFSANKSGEYFGYARMTSPISEDATQVFGTIQRHEPAEALDAPRTIPTPATEFAPKGHIIDDSARGTIFWEADHSDEEEVEEPKESVEQHIDAEGSGGQQVWGKPFKIEWLSTNRLPFYRTRGLRNPWNANREVKIARDGTELEPSVGNRLVQMFHRMGQPSGPTGQLPAMPQMPPPQMGGPPHMRQY